MIGLFVILVIMGTVFLVACTCIVGGMIWTGRIAVPGSEAHRVRRARTDEQIALHEASRANYLLQKAQAEARRQILEAQSSEDLQKIWDDKFHKELAAPEEDRIEIDRRFG